MSDRLADRPTDQVDIARIGGGFNDSIGNSLPVARAPLERSDLRSNQGAQQARPGLFHAQGSGCRLQQREIERIP